MFEKSDVKKYKISCEQKDDSGNTQIFTRVVHTNLELSTKDQDQLKQIFAFFPHTWDRSWQKQFYSFQPSLYPPHLVKLAANAFDLCKNTMLCIVAEAGYDLPALQALLEMGAEIDAYDERGKTAIFWAINNKLSCFKKDSVEALGVLKCLLDNGASTELTYKDDCGTILTPFQYAESRGFRAAATMIQRHKEQMQTAGQSKLLQGFVGFDIPKLPEKIEEKQYNKNKVQDILNPVDGAPFTQDTCELLPPLQSALNAGFLGYNNSLTNLDNITLQQFIDLHNKSAYEDNPRVIKAMSASQLKSLLKESCDFRVLFQKTYLQKDSFELLLSKLGLNYFKEVMGFNNGLKWDFLSFSHMPEHLKRFLLLNDNSFIDEIKKCDDLGAVFRHLPVEEHSLVYERLGHRLYSIVDNLFDTRDIPKTLHPVLFQKLGLRHLASLVDNGYYLKTTLAQLPDSSRFPFVELVGFDKIRGYLRNENESVALLELMPKETHATLKKHFVLFEVAVEKVPEPDITPPKKKTTFPLKSDKTGYSDLYDPIILDEHRVLGFSSIKSENCFYRRHLVLYNHQEDRIESQFPKLSFVKKVSTNTFVAHQFNTNLLYKLEWLNQKLICTKNAYIQWHENGEERFESMISLSPNKWLLLSLESNAAINTYKGWYIDLLDIENFSLERVLTVHRDQHCYVTQLSLLPDGNTLMAWDNFSTVKPKEENCCSTTFQICLIDSSNFKAQTFTLPIDPKQYAGTLNKVITDEKQVRLEIATEPNFLWQKSNSLGFNYHFNFQYKALKHSLGEKLENSASFFAGSSSPNRNSELGKVDAMTIGIGNL